MIRTKIGYFPSCLVCLFFCTSLYAEQLTVESLIGLRDMGFSEAEIQEQVTRTGEPVSLSAADIEALKQAGFSEEMIRFVQNPPPPEPAAQPQPAPVAPPPAPPPQEGPVTRPADRPPPVQERPAFSEQLLQIQQCLNQLGYNAGVADGFMGPQTRNAIQRFQTDIGVAADGQASAELLAALNARLAQRGPQPNDGAPQQLVGAWYGIFQDAYGNQTEMYLDLFPDGSFTSSSSSPMGYAEGQGRYQVQGNVLVMQSYYGQIEQYRFRLAGQQLIVNMPQVGADVVFTRYE